MELSTQEEAEPQVVFRAGKKRKNYRQRPVDSETPGNEAASTSEPADQPRPVVIHTEEEEEEEQSSVAEALRLRNARKSKLRGVGFRPEDGGGSKPQSGDNPEQSLVLRGAQEEEGLSPADVIAGMGRRFAPQTGLTGELVNKHMEEYIESELARRHRMEPPPSAAATQAPTTNPLPTSGTMSMLGKRPAERPTMQGKLQEIDLGEESRARNIARTEQAHRRMQGDASELDTASPPAKMRIGKDGKPWRPRKRRDSDDIKRDQMVEDFLHENRLDVYDVAPQQGAGDSAADDEAAADDRIAEQFRREFMEAMSERRRRRRAAPQNSRRDNKPGKKDDEVLKGPKLGGSRNDRAAMRELLLREQERKKNAKR